jgi:hypothetical protein
MELYLYFPIRVHGIGLFLCMCYFSHNSIEFDIAGEAVGLVENWRGMFRNNSSFSSLRVIPDEGTVLLTLKREWLIEFHVFDTWPLYVFTCSKKHFHICHSGLLQSGRRHWRIDFSKIQFHGVVPPVYAFLRWGWSPHWSYQQLKFLDPNIEYIIL